jgi:superfamily I DNA/RNA helicase
VINIPRRSIGEKTQNLFFDACKEARIPALFALLRFVDPSQEPLNLKLSARSASALMNASHWFTGLRDACQSSNSHPISTALSYILTEGGYKEYLTGMCKTEEEAECRLENVQVMRITTFDKRRMLATT